MEIENRKKELLLYQAIIFDMTAYLDVSCFNIVASDLRIVHCASNRKKGGHKNLHLTILGSNPFGCLPTIVYFRVVPVELGKLFWGRVR